jgi:hypothetical protein
MVIGWLLWYSTIAGPDRGNRAMTVEAVVYAGGVLLISLVIWQMHRANIRLSEIQHEVSGLRDLVSRLFLTAPAEKSDGKIAAPDAKEAAKSTHAREEIASAPPPGIESDLVQVDALCARLITLAPPKVALSLTSKPDFWRERPWPLRKP